MSTNRLFYVVMVVFLALTACAPQPVTPTSIPTPTEEQNPADRFTGTWTGTMSMVDDPTVNAMAVVTIPTGCSAGSVCGDALNTANGCKWEMSLISVAGDVLEYNYSKTLEGECPALGDGTFTLNSDGSLFREHKFPDFTITGTLTRQSAEQTPADRFAGTWSGVMSFTDDANRKEDIVVTIPTGCVTGSVCGDINNTTVGCQWEMTLASLDRDVFTYTFSKTMSGECPALGGGTLTLGSDGTLMREHKTPDFTASGRLTKK